MTSSKWKWWGKREIKRSRRRGIWNIRLNENRNHKGLILMCSSSHLQGFSQRIQCPNSSKQMTHLFLQGHFASPRSHMWQCLQGPSLHVHHSIISAWLCVLFILQRSCCHRFQLSTSKLEINSAGMRFSRVTINAIKHPFSAQLKLKKND